jgi:N-acetylglucosaminyldiphosphoundecaprenol N-acetyl-beta-D-mannosaminyltransferase
MSTEAVQTRRPEVPRSSRAIGRLSILGVPVSIVRLEVAASTILEWARAGDLRTVFVRDTASLMLAVDQPELLALHKTADLVVPDGTPLSVIGRLRGHMRDMGRVAGADLVDAVCAGSADGDVRHFFFGGAPGVAQAMAQRLRAKYHNLRIAGCYSPPMRDIGPGFAITGEAALEVEQIRSSGAAIVWVGLSSPKQEYWMAAAGPLLERGVLIGVGAAFDFHAGRVSRAPRWMRDHGLEWLHRLIKEPRRLWRRYLVLVPRFVVLVTIETLAKRPRSAL